MSTVPLLKIPAIGIGWLLAYLESLIWDNWATWFCPSRLSWASCHSDGRGARISRTVQGILQSELTTSTSSVLPYSTGQSQLQGLPDSSRREADFTSLLRTGYMTNDTDTKQEKELVQSTILILFPLQWKYKFGIL